MSARFFFSHASNVSVVVSLWSNAFGGIWLFLEKFALQCLPILGRLLRYIFFLFTLCLPLLYWFLSLIFIFIPGKYRGRIVVTPADFLLYSSISLIIFPLPLSLDPSLSPSYTYTSQSPFFHWIFFLSLLGPPFILSFLCGLLSIFVLFCEHIPLLLLCCTEKLARGNPISLTSDFLILKYPCLIPTHYPPHNLLCLYFYVLLPTFWYPLKHWQEVTH